MRAEGQLDRVTRRAFLHLAGRGALALEALGVAPRPRGQPWDELDGLRGAVVRPGAAAYGTARLGWNQRHDGVLPRAIVQCADVDDVRRTLAWARRHDLWGVPRAGGHSYAGYSLCDGVVLDVARLKRLSVDAATRTAVVGAGNRLGDVYAGLAAQGFGFAAGTCPTVGLSGLALGGGLGFRTREFGLACDNVLELELETAGGDVLRCNAQSHPDLYWACRGGGGGSLGVVTAFALQVFPVATVAWFYLQWPWSAAAVVLDAWQRWVPAMPEALGTTWGLDASGRGGGVASRAVGVVGVYRGPEAHLVGLMRPLLAASPRAPTRRLVAASSFLESIAEMADPESTERAGRASHLARSDYFARPLPADAAATLVRWLDGRGDAPLQGDAEVQFIAPGGAHNRPARDATAYPHRDGAFYAEYRVVWTPRPGEDLTGANARWLQGLWGELRPHGTGGAYVNCPDPDLPDWPRAYYGDNLARLVDVKARYDPDHVFHCAQSIPTRL